MNNKVAIKLIRPLITFDLESTGVDTENDRIVQIAAIKEYPNGVIEEKNVFVNPEIPIPTEASDIHGITNEMVKDAPIFKQLAVGICNWFKDCDISGFNSDSYDVNLMVAEMERAGVSNFLNWEYNLLDVMKLYRNLYPNTLSAIYERLTGEPLENAHDAMSDLIGTQKVLNIIYPLLLGSTEEKVETPKDIDLFLQGDKKRVDIAGKMYEDKDGIIRWNFSKNKDQPVLSDLGFVGWFLKQNFPQQSKNTIIKLQQNKNNE